MAPPKRDVTIKDVAKAAGVSLGTASRVLNDHVKVGSGLRDRVRKAMDDLEYRPNSVAQSMRSRLSHTIGCILREINIPAMGAFVRAAHDTFDEAGFSLLITNSEGRREREIQLLRRLSSRQVDGVLLGPHSTVDEEFDRLLRNMNIPLVLIDRDMPEWIDSVLVDHATAIKTATKYLLDMGHRRIGLITGHAEIYPARERIRGYKLAFEEAGLVHEPGTIQANSFLPSAGFRHLSSMLGGSNRPTAVISGGIDMLPGVIRAIRSRDLQIPGDISVVTSGDSELADLFSPSIAVVRWNQSEVGRIAAELILERIQHKIDPAPRRIVVSNEFLVRESITHPKLT